MAPATGRGGRVEAFGGRIVIVDWPVGETVWMLGRTRTGVLEEVPGAEVNPLGEREKSVPGFVGMDAEGEDVVEPRLNVPFMLF